MKLYAKNDDDLKGLLSTVKRFSDDIEMQFGQGKYVKVTFKKDSQEKSKNITLDINTIITEGEHNKTYKYFGINEANDIK